MGTYRTSLTASARWMSTPPRSLWGHNTIVMHNTCEDSLLATPLILDLVILADMTSRIQYKRADMKEWASFHPIMSILSYLIKAPLVPQGAHIVNALFKQRACIENVFRACVGLPADNFMLLEHKRGVNDEGSHAYKTHHAT